MFLCDLSKLPLICGGYDPEFIRSVSVLKRSSLNAADFHDFFRSLLCISTKQDRLPENIMTGIPDLSMACLRTLIFYDAASMNKSAHVHILTRRPEMLSNGALSSINSSGYAHPCTT